MMGKEIMETKTKGCPPLSGRFCVGVSLLSLVDQLQYLKNHLQQDYADFDFHIMYPLFRNSVIEGDTPPS